MPVEVQLHCPRMTGRKVGEVFLQELLDGPPRAVIDTHSKAVQRDGQLMVRNVLAQPLVKVNHEAHAVLAGEALPIRIRGPIIRQERAPETLVEPLRRWRKEDLGALGLSKESRPEEVGVRHHRGLALASSHRDELGVDPSAQVVLGQKVVSALGVGEALT